jgi:hypothetical protein
VNEFHTAAVKAMSKSVIWQTMRTRIEAAMMSAKDPLTMKKLIQADDWFQGCEGMEDLFEYIFHEFMSEGLNIIRTTRICSIERISRKQWESAKRECTRLLRGAGPMGINEEDARLICAESLMPDGQKLENELFHDVTLNTSWSDDESKMLVGLAGTVECQVHTVLNASSHPLRVNEVKSSIQVFFGGCTHSDAHIEKACKKIGFDHGMDKYGLRKHCPLDEEQMNSMMVASEKIVSANLQKTKWDVMEIIGALINSGQLFNGQLRKHTLNIALKNSSMLSDLGKFTWRLKSEYMRTAQEKITAKLRFAES